MADDNITTYLCIPQTSLSPSMALSLLALVDPLSENLKNSKRMYVCKALACDPLT